MASRVFYIIQKELLIERRESYSLLSAILYLTIISFVVFKLFPDMRTPTRCGIYWIMIMFTSIIVVGDSFDQKTLKRKLSHFHLYNSFEFVTAKLIWNYSKLWFSAMTMLGLFGLFSSKGYQDLPSLTLMISLSLVGIVGTLTLVSSMVVHAGSKSGLAAVLAFPLLIPILMISMKLNLVFEKVISDTSYGNDLLMLGGINVLIITLTIIFFSFTWKQ